MNDSKGSRLSTQRLKTALITGAAARIGAAIVRDLAANGFAVAIHANSSTEAADQLAGEIVAAGGQACVVKGDLTVSEECGSILPQAVSALGPVNLLVNNASIFEVDTIHDISDRSFDRHFAIHVKAPAFLTRDFAAALPADIHGSVVNIIDQRVWALNPRFFSYMLSKSALWTATRTMAQALAPQIRVNAIGPGPTLKGDRQDAADFAAQVDGLILKAGPELGEFGRTIRFLFDTPSITGQMIALDGGQHLAWQTPDILEIKE